MSIDKGQDISYDGCWAIGEPKCGSSWVAEQEKEDLASIRSELSRLAKRRQDRITEWSRQMPTEWTPGKVTNPEVDMPFTDAGAWLFVAQLLDAGHPIQQVTLRQSRSEAAY